MVGSNVQPLSAEFTYEALAKLRHNAFAATFGQLEGYKAFYCKGNLQYVQRFYL
jgi:hypothetical protein